MHVLVDSWESHSGSRVVCYQVSLCLVNKRFSVKVYEAGLFAKHVFDGNLAEQHDKAGLENGPLRVQPILRAGLQLIGARVPVLRRSAFHTGRYVYAAACQVMRFQKAIEVRTGRTNERAALRILLLAGGFTEEHHDR